MAKVSKKHLTYKRLARFLVTAEKMFRIFVSERTLPCRHMNGGTFMGNGIGTPHFASAHFALAHSHFTNCPNPFYH